MFSNYIREGIKGQSMPFSEISKLVGDRWQALPPGKREEWKAAAMIPWEKYKEDMAAYQKTEDFEKYEQYVAKFKAAQEAKESGGIQRVSSSRGFAGDLQQLETFEPNADQSSFAGTISPTHQKPHLISPIVPGPTAARKYDSKFELNRAGGQGQASSTGTARGARVSQGMCFLFLFFNHSPL